MITSSLEIFHRVGDLDVERYLFLSSDKARRDEIFIVLSDEEEDVCGRFHFVEVDGREELERVHRFTATAANATTALPPVAAVSGCESDDGTSVAREDSQLRVSPVGEVVIIYG